jgi:glycosyltransferase involved in cell wall biosynthesis
MRILWLSNKILSSDDGIGTATWLGAMAQALVDSGAVTLGNIAPAHVSSPVRRDYGPVQQWVVPLATLKPRHLLSTNGHNAVLKCVQAFSPDLVHVWGTEHRLGLLSARNMIPVASLLEIQGLKSAIARVYHGGLNAHEQLACIGLKELVRYGTIGRNQREFQRWAAIEKEIIARHGYISAHSQWATAQARQLNPDGRIFQNDRMLRPAFYEAAPWQASGSQTIFCSSAYAAPFKGLHVAIRAVALLKARFPKIVLCIAGAHQKQGLRQSGYAAWLQREAKRLGVEEHICWLGPLSAEPIIAHLQASAVFLSPSFAESYCNALAEAMIIGVPSVVSYAGGLACLAEHNVTGLFFPPGDETMCAYQIARLLEDRDLAERMSPAARRVGLQRNDRRRVANEQLAIYRQIIEA